eukprot:TRINITY_DN2600_c0_g1_i11.p5 TRINITY_DN2600_c0_g1~~TRINITY_DN2600_c0_g1_i11.p5  ORF type:complete len:242 (-),score=22.31 TRINITY_DN2600_c0_g1_i11:1079-1804(-)
MRRGSDPPPPSPSQPARGPERLPPSPLGGAHGTMHEAVDAGAPSPPHAATPPRPLPGPPSGAYRGMEHTPQRQYLPPRPPPSGSSAGGFEGLAQGGARSGLAHHPLGGGAGLMAPPVLGGVPRQQHPLLPGHSAPLQSFGTLASLSPFGAGSGGGGPRRRLGLAESSMGLPPRLLKHDPGQPQQQQPLHPPQQLQPSYGGTRLRCRRCGTQRPPPGASAADRCRPSARHPFTRPPPRGSVQ